jgi:hypothetical protein
MRGTNREGTKEKDLFGGVFGTDIDVLETNISVPGAVTEATTITR